MTHPTRARTAIRQALVVVDSDAMRQVADEIEDVAGRETHAVVEGERGTGRELIARVLHVAGARRGGPFVSVEAAAAPRALYDDALDNPVAGPLRDAYGGTLLVKNLCALGVAAQQRIARVVCGRAAEVDVRIIGACDHDLDAAVEAGVFDAEMYEALVQHRIALPPLRHRVADIAPLAVHFVRDYATQIGRGRVSLSTRAFDRLEKHPWPGNVAELKDLTRRLVIRTQSTRIEASDVDAVLPTVAERTPAEQMSLEDLVRAKLRGFLQRMDDYPLARLYDDVLARIERPLFELVMEHTGGNQLRAAEVLGLNRNTLRRKLAEHGLGARTLRAPAKPRPSAIAARTARAPRERSKR